MADKLQNIYQSGVKKAKATIFLTLYKEKRRYNLNRQQKNNNKIVSKIWFFMQIMAGSLIQSKLYKKSMLHYNNKD